MKASTGDVRRLSHVTRFSSIPVSVLETTAEHSFWVTLFSMMIHRHLGAPDEHVAEITTHAVLHDLAECVTGDVVRTFKYATPEIKQAVDDAELILTEKLLPPEVKSLYAWSEGLAPGENPQDYSDYAKAVVKAADWMSLYHYMRREAARGNREIIPFYNRMTVELGKAGEKAYGTWTPEFSGLFKAMTSEANRVGRDCFGDSMVSPRWNREV